MKHFIITIDTEGDNLWDYYPGKIITTENARYIPRFQELCDRYNYKPIYLVNYEMANDAFFVTFAQVALREARCEIGLHLHAWNTPPAYEIKQGRENPTPYLIEYPESIMSSKFDTMFNLLHAQFDTDIVSHRAGRWAMNKTYFDILMKYGLKIDCSVTPHVSWKNVQGVSYTDSPEEPFLEQTILEVPVTIRRLHSFFLNENKSPIKRTISAIKSCLKGKTIWLRPNGNNVSEMLALIDHIEKSDSNYLMFMLHSSELMDGGSPTFRTHESIEKLYDDLEIIFNRISHNFTGITLKSYYEYHYHH
jgi:hypothetical protein